MTRHFLIAAAAFFGFLCDSYQPVRAETESIVVDMSVYGQAEYGDFFRRAEAIASDEITRQFSQSPNLSEVQVMVLGDRNGQIAPILTTTVSRTQWQETPSVSVWTKYYNASYALLQRYEGQQTETMAGASNRATRANRMPIAQIDRAFDEGRLTGTAAQEYLDELD